MLGAATLHAQERSTPSASRPAARSARGTQAGPKTVGDYASDVVVVHDAQGQALEQVREMQERVEDPQTRAALDAAMKEMERALIALEEAKQSHEKLPSALAAEQTAYQALLKLAAREYQVSRSRSGQQGGQQGERGMRQLDQLDLKQAENRYETQRQATPQQSAQQREQLQVSNRLKELAQRQQDLNERIKELQTALQEAKNEEEREEIRRRLKRLREEEQEMLSDIDELRQRMERPENQSQMAEERQQLENTRAEVQRASEALENNSVSQALTSGTRAQRELQQLQDEFRKKNSGQFSEDMRRMRNEARELAQREEEIAKKIDELDDPKHKTLGDSEERRELANQLAQQKGGLTNLFTEMRQVSEQSETAEPLLSKQLYDLLRQTGQDELNKSLDLSSELVQRGFLPQARPFEQRTRQSIDELKRGVERAAESVLGDEAEALRLAKRELEDLSQQLEKEIAQAGNQQANEQGRDGAGSERQAASARQAGANSKRPEDRANGQNPTEQQSEQRSDQTANQDSRQGNRQGQQSGRGANGASPDQQRGEQQLASADGQSPGSESSQGQQGRSRSPRASAGSQADGNATDASQASEQRGGSRAGGRRNFFDRGGGGGSDGGRRGGPLTGEGFVDWSDRLRDVEEMLDLPDLRTEVARIRDRARAVRLEYRRHGDKPDWAVVKLQIAGPLVEVRSRVAEELARRESNEALVPIDRDPVPARFSELVRRYYEQLGKSD